MNIIVCNDQRREAMRIDNTLDSENVKINMDVILIKKMKKAGHNVWLFDGYDKDQVTPILEPHKAASHLMEMICKVRANGMVFDIQYWNNFTFGITMLRNMVKEHGIPKDMLLVIYSRFIDENTLRTLLSLGLKKEHILDRNTKKIEKVIEIFGNI